jgi:hypothetical protein
VENILKEEQVDAVIATPKHLMQGQRTLTIIDKKMNL